MTAEEIREQEQQTIRREVFLRRAIEREVSKLIEVGAATVRRLKPQGGRSLMEENQIRNLLNVAMETSCVDVVTNFIRYQIGRSPGVWGDDENKFGPTLIRDIETGAILQAAEQVKKSVSDAVGEEHVGDTFDRAYLQLTRLYLGYATRMFYYAKKREDAKDAKAWENLFRAQEGGKRVT